VSFGRENYLLLTAVFPGLREEDESCRIEPRKPRSHQDAKSYSKARRNKILDLEEMSGFAKRDKNPESTQP
jgi:hypothetical protein